MSLPTYEIIKETIKDSNPIKEKIINEVLPFWSNQFNLIVFIIIIALVGLIFYYCVIQYYTYFIPSNCMMIVIDKEKNKEKQIFGEKSYTLSGKEIVKKIQFYQDNQEQIVFERGPYKYISNDIELLSSDNIGVTIKICLEWNFSSEDTSKFTNETIDNIIFELSTKFIDFFILKKYENNNVIAVGVQTLNLEFITNYNLNLTNSVKILSLTMISITSSTEAKIRSIELQKDLSDQDRIIKKNETEFAQIEHSLSTKLKTIENEKKLAIQKLNDEIELFKKRQVLFDLQNITQQKYENKRIQDLIHISKGNSDLREKLFKLFYIQEASLNGGQIHINLESSNSLKHVHTEELIKEKEEDQKETVYRGFEIEEEENQE